MENPADYDIDKDMGEEDADETRIGKINLTDKSPSRKTLRDIWEILSARR